MADVGAARFVGPYIHWPMHTKMAHVRTDADDVVDALMLASRALVGVAAESIATVDSTLSLPQFRALVVLAGGPITVGQLADRLDVHTSTVTRLCDRLVARELISREPAAHSRREVVIALTGSGRSVVRRVMRRRRSRLAGIVDALPAKGRPAVVAALQAFADAAGESPEPSWAVGWEPLGE